MDRNTMTILILLGVLIVGGSLGQYYITDPWWKQNFGIVLMGLLIGGIVSQEVLFRLTAAQFGYVEMEVRPRDEELRLMCRQVTCALSQSGEYVTKILLANAVEFAPYGMVKEININSKTHTNSAFRWKPGKAYYKEYEIWHPNTCRIVVKEQSKSGVSLDRGERIPTLYLREAPNYIDGNLIVIKGGDKGMSDKLINTTRDLEEVKKALAEKQYEATTEKSAKQVAQELWGEQQNETQTLWKSRLSISDSGFLRVLGYLKDYGTLEKVAEIMGSGRGGKQYIKWLLPTVLVAGIAVIMATQPQYFDKLMAWMAVTNNQIFAGVLAISTAAFAYLYMRHRRSAV